MIYKIKLWLSLPLVIKLECTIQCNWLKHKLPSNHQNMTILLLHVTLPRLSPTSTPPSIINSLLNAARPPIRQKGLRKLLIELLIAHNAENRHHHCSPLSIVELSLQQPLEYCVYSPLGRPLFAHSSPQNIPLHCWTTGSGYYFPFIPTRHSYTGSRFVVASFLLEFATIFNQPHHPTLC